MKGFVIIMNPFEVIAGVLMLLASVMLIFIVLSQESKGQGLSGVITGTEMMSNESRARSKEARMSRATKVVAIVFFALTIATNVISLLVK